MAFQISDTEFVLARQRNDAIDALAIANASIRNQNVEIVRLRRALTAAQAQISELKAENLEIGQRLIGMLRPIH